MSLWVNKTVNNDIVHFIGFRQPGAQASFWQIYTWSGKIDFSSWDANSTMLGVNAPGEAIINTWLNIVATYENGNWKIYINGVLKGSNTSNSNFQNDVNQELTIGNSGGFQPYYGKIDDVRIYRRALSQADVTYLATH